MHMDRIVKQTYKQNEKRREKKRERKKKIIIITQI